MDIENKEFDFCIIGGGYGGLIAGLNALRNNLSVAIIERRALMGGTCLWEGCIPSKLLLNSSYKYYEAKNELHKYGVKCSNVDFDFDMLMKKKENLLNTMGNNNTNKLKSLGGEIFHGWGKVKSSNEVEVTLSDKNNEKKIIKCKNIILNMGGQPTTLPGNAIPIDGKHIITSTEALSLEKIPRSMVIVGGGYIGMELGSHYKRLGCNVTIVEFRERVLTFFDSDLSIKIKEILEKQGIKFILNTKVIGGGFDLDKNNVRVIVEDVLTKNSYELSSDILFIATGRKPLTNNCGLEENGVLLDKFGRVIVNEKLQSSVQNIYAIGDVSHMGPPLAHKAEDEALALIDQYLGKPTHLNYSNIPSVVYTHPEVASVGKSEEELIKENIPYKKGLIPLTANPRAKCNDETDGFIKILVEKETNRILGVHMIGPQVGEQIMEAVLCLEFSTTSDLIGRVSHGHPMFAEAFKDAAIAATKGT